MRLTQLMNQKGFPHFGLKLANMAAELAPHYSAAHVEVAKSELAIAGELSNSDHEQIAEHQRNAYNALTVAQRLCPQNAEIYKVQLGYLKADLAAKTTAEGEPLQWGNATRFVDASLRYLEYASNLSSEETISTLLDICRGREIIWRMHEGIRDPAKTIIVEDLETGLLLADNHHIFREDIDRIIAADTYGEHGRIASLLAQDLDPEIYDKLMLPFLEGMDRLAYRDDDGSVTPREAWLDRIAGRTQRWHYAGTLYQDDYQTPPTTLLEWKVQMLSEQRRAEGVVHVAEVEPRLPVTSFRLGQVLNEAGMFEGRSGLSIALKDYPTHMLLAARSGGGKTRTLGLIAEHSVEMGLKVILQELGIKSELLQEMQRMQAKGIPFERIAPGDSSAIPVSLSFLHPPHPSIPIEAHLAAMTEAFTMVYGGYQPDSAIGPIITTALRLLYLANGHDVPPLIDTAADEWECTVPQDKPYIASLSEFEEYLLERSQGYQKGTDAANLPQFFRNRLESWKGGPLANGLFGNNIIDLDKLLQGSVNYYIDPSNIRNENEKLFWIAVLEAHIKNYLKYVLHESPNGQPRIAILTDEAQRLLRCYPEGDPRREITESYGYAQREQRTYGVARIGATQTATGINQESISQTGLVIAGPLKEHGDKVTILSSMGIDVTHPRFRDLYERFNRLSPGQALVWKAGMAEPIAVAIELTAQPDMSRLTARTVHPLPIQPNFYNSFTDHDVQQATRIAQEQSPNQASLRHLVRGMILSHITGKPMPIASADALRMYQSLPNNELVLRVMLDAEISRRSTAISSAYDPAELGRSVWSYIRSQLGRNPGTSNVMASSAFVLPQAVAAEERLRIGSRKLGVPQTFASYAWSLGIRALLGANDYRDRESGRNQMLPELHLDERQRAVELVSGLLAHPLYPAHGTRNQQILIKGVLGKDRRGASIVRDLHLLGTRPTSLEQVEGSYEARLYWRRLYHLGGTVLTGASITSPLITPFEAALFAAEDVDERQAMTAVAALPNL